MTDQTPDTADMISPLPVELPALPPADPHGMSAELETLRDVPLEVTVEIGRVRMAIRDIIGLREGAVVELDRLAGAPVDVRANGTLIARGDIVVVGDDLSVKITSIENHS
jgi:flagellar motor switch protein FliN/FliY